MTYPTFTTIDQIQSYLNDNNYTFNDTIYAFTRPNDNIAIEFTLDSHDVYHINPFEQ